MKSSWRSDNGLLCMVVGNDSLSYTGVITVIKE